MCTIETTQSQRTRDSYEKGETTMKKLIRQVIDLLINISFRAPANEENYLYEKASLPPYPLYPGSARHYRFWRHTY
jgi:hypothetical protein